MAKVSKKSKPQRRQLTASEKLEVGARQKWCCAICQAMLTAELDFDHIVPLHQGGSNHVKNFRALCLPCHRKITREQRRRFFDKQREARTRKSRFFDERSVDFIPLHPTLSEFLERCRYRREEKQKEIRAAVDASARVLVEEPLVSPAHKDTDSLAPVCSPPHSIIPL